VWGLQLLFCCFYHNHLSIMMKKKLSKMMRSMKKQNGERYLFWKDS